jgi:ABC-2 type transport system ATP-binding protein
MIELQNVTKRFGDRLAVDDLTLVVPPGEIFGLLGQNGAGKSTAIGMMLGQVWPTAGTVKVCGHEVSRERQRALQPVGAIFETPVFYDYLSGSSNLQILSQYSAPTSKARIQEVIEWVGLAGREKSKVKTYSHGMRARLALAQALLPNPKLLILDEPSDGLDPEGIHEIRQTILRLRRELGMTIFLSSHLLNEVELICTRIALLKKGRKLFEGSLAEAKSRQSLIRLRTDDFPAAASLLRQAGLISDHRDGQFISLAPGIGTDKVVRHLVQAGRPVFEIAAQEMTLEDFYLELMTRDDHEKRRRL